MLKYIRFRLFRLVHFIQSLLLMWALDRAYRRMAKESVDGFMKLPKDYRRMVKESVDGFMKLPKEVGSNRASFVTFDFNTKRKEIVIYGDNPGIDNTAMAEILEKVAESIKGESNFGLGLQSFLKFSDKFTFISKKNGEHFIFSEAPHADDSTIYSFTGKPHLMNRQEEIEYSEYCRRLQKYTDGTIYIIENVGVGIQGFSMTKDLSKPQVIKYLRTKCNVSLRNLRVSIIIDGDSPEVVTAKDGSGTRYSFSVPSSKCPYDKPRIVILNGKEFELSIHVDVWVGNKNSGAITIGQKRGKEKAIQNELPINVAYSHCMKLGHGSIFRLHKLTHYLDGHVYFTLFSKEGIEPPSVYPANRDHLLLDSTFGDILSNLLNAADIDVLRPAAEKKEEESANRTDEKLNRRYEKLLADFLSSVEFDFLLDTNYGAVKSDPKRVCPNCKQELPLERSSVYNQSPVKINKVFFVKLSDREFYQCGMCKHEWNKPERGPQEGKPKTPIYEPPTGPEDSKIRERTRGKGYNIRLFDFGKNDSRLSVFIAPALIEINTGHPHYESIEDSRVQHLRNFSLICTEIVTHNESVKNRPIFEQLKAIQEMFSAFCSRYEGLDLRNFN